MDKFSVVFMGCPDFAVPSLRAIVADARFKVTCVYSMPDRPGGRGKRDRKTPVKEFALENGIDVRAPTSFKGASDAAQALSQLTPDFLVVVAYGLILPLQILEIPRVGAINLHASLLPAYRGPAPIHFALLNGENYTGSTVMLMNEKMDEGDILGVSKIAIDPDESFRSLHDRLAEDGASLLPLILKSYGEGKISPVPQDSSKASYTKKICPELAKIDWGKRSEILVRHIRAMTPCPGAWFELDGQRYKVGLAYPGPEVGQPSGQIVEAGGQTGITVSTGENTSLSIRLIQRPGKSMVPISEFLCGFRGELLGRTLA